MSTTKKCQHFVPQSYSKNFCNFEGKLWVFDKDTFSSFQTTPKKIANEKYFYDFPTVEDRKEQKVENFFSNEVEPLQAQLINSFLDTVHSSQKDNIPFQKLLTKSTKIAFAHILSFQWLRTREHRKFISHFFDHTKFDLRRDAKEIYDRKTNKLINQLDETSKEILENLLITIEDDVINGCIKNLEYLYSEEGVSFIQARNLSFRAPFCAEIFLKHIWIVGLNTFGQEKAFYTSDNPVGKRPHFKSSGIASKGIEICFPLSSEVILILWEREYFKKGEVYEDRVIQLTKEQINHYNSIQVTSSDRFVYCRDNDFGFAEEIIKTSPYDLSSSRKRFKSKICWS